MEPCPTRYLPCSLWHGQIRLARLFIGDPLRPLGELTPQPAPHVGAGIHLGREILVKTTEQTTIIVGAQIPKVDRARRTIGTVVGGTTLGERHQVLRAPRSWASGTKGHIRFPILGAVVGQVGLVRPVHVHHIDFEVPVTARPEQELGTVWCEERIELIRCGSVR